MSKLVGHPLDIEMLTESKYEIDQSDREIAILNENLPLEATMKNKDDSVFVIKRFEFDSDLQRASVLVMDSLDSDHHYFISKGSSESILSVCNPPSIPKDYEEIYKKYSLEGYYVISCAIKKIIGFCDVSKPRNELENGLSFVGFILFRNRVKPEAIPTIGILQDANIRSIMITGDNSMNAIHVSREIGMMKDVLLLEKFDDNLVSCIVPLESKVDHKPSQALLSYRHCETLQDLDRVFRHSPLETKIATSGEVIDMICDTKDEEFLDYVMERCDIFARAKPRHKSQLIEKLISMKKVVGFCGDGNI